jgi:hypothetical protein
MSAVATAAPPSLDPDRLASFVSALCKQRQEAIQGRKGSGIEEDWLEDEEHYQGIDDANRHYSRSWLASIKSGAAVRVPNEGETSTAFLNVTRPVVDTGAAKVADILLPTDDRAELDPAMLAQLPSGAVDPAAMVLQAQAQADKSATAMQTEIDDLLTECNWQGEVRQVIEDAARIGSGVLKGPFPRKTKQKKFSLTPAGAALQIAQEIQPASKWVSPWNFFPDPACGENIHNGSYTFERDYLTHKTLQDLIGQPGYNDAEIRLALKEGAKAHDATDSSARPLQGVKGQFELWTYYGQVQPEDLTAAGVDPEQIKDDANPVDALALLVNDRLIKVTFNALDTGEFPYDVLAWQRRPGMPWGTGISRHARTPQRMLNAGVRQMLDNGALSCAPQIIIGNGVTPHDGRLEVRGRKLWRVEADGAPDVNHAMASFTVKSTQPECMGIITLAMQMVEETTGMPSILSGQEPDRKETLGQAQMRVNNASGVMRRLAKRFDDYITKPHVRRYYDWLMQYSNKSDIKGDFDIDVRGSSALVEKHAQLQFMLTMMAYAKDPAYGMNPYRLTAEIIKSNRMKPATIQVPEDEYQGSQGPGPVDAAKIELTKAQTDLAKAAQDKAQADAAKTRGDTMYATIEGAKEIAMNSLIAPVADQIGASIGLEDQNAPPLVATPPAGLPVGPAVPQNTSPQSPPRPNAPMPTEMQPQIPAAQSPDVGIRSGIEGGQPKP